MFETTFVSVQQRMFVEGIECTITKMMPLYPRLMPSPVPFVRIIALPGSRVKEEKAKITVSAGEHSVQNKIPHADGPGERSAKG